jgi:hypothetical protein
MDFKHALDLTAIGTTVGTLSGYLPAIAALFTIVWTGIRIYDRFKGNKDHE